MLYSLNNKNYIGQYMLTLHIDNNEIENIFVKGFNSNKENFLTFIQNSYNKRESLKAYHDDKERFMETYKNIKNGSMEMLTEKDAQQEIDTFIDTL